MTLRVANIVLWGIIGFSLVTGVLALSGCAQKTREQYQQEQLEHTPVLICKKGNVEVWRVRDVETCLWVYFTVPNGDVSWTVPGDDDTPDKRFHVQGIAKRTE